MAKHITIGGRISADSIDLLVVDDGLGMPDTAGPEAASRGRLGLASMRRRAKAIGAELAIEGTRAGTRVAVAWRQ
jgi:signal transduction histidine kinase